MHLRPNTNLFTVSHETQTPSDKTNTSSVPYLPPFPLHPLPIFAILNDIQTKEYFKKIQYIKSVLPDKNNRFIFLISPYFLPVVYYSQWPHLPSEYCLHIRPWSSGHYEGPEFSLHLFSELLFKIQLLYTCLIHDPHFVIHVWLPFSIISRPRLRSSSDGYTAYTLLL